LSTECIFELNKNHYANTSTYFTISTNDELWAECLYT
jgi:hypothetical protein